MYKDLIMRLREAPNDWPDANLHYEAADAIEELSRRIERAVDLYNRDVEKTAMYEALAGISPEPPKEEDNG